MQLHTIFNMKMQCSVLLPHVLLTRRQFQHLKYSVCPSVYTDDSIFTRKNRLIIVTCCLYCQTNRLRRLVRLSINMAVIKNGTKTHKIAHLYSGKSLLFIKYSQWE